MLNRVIAALLLTLSAAIVFAQEKLADTLDFHGTYEELKPAQKKLIDEWYADYNRMSGDHSQPTEYNTFSLSTRTTYEAVTHALMTTNLTDKQGKSLGTALDLVQAIEAINGKVPKARGDLQFRLYVMLKPNAVETLTDSTQFFRDRDNTVYHHGYPLNYRQDGGAPSIQISVAKDQRHADIDVDYRSSKFPAALVNGHLSAANSDVRAGNNTQRHLQRWQGLTDWWRNLFGLADTAKDSDETPQKGDIPAVPAKGDGKLQDAVQDFLSSWLVQQKPELAAAYLSPRSYFCLEEYGPQAGEQINGGTAAYVAARDMGRTNELIGKVSSLTAAVQPTTLDGHGLKLTKQNPAFSLYDVSKGAATEFECDADRAYSDYDHARITGTTGKYGTYYAAVFRLRAPKGKSDTITLLWMKEGKYWKVVSWDIDPQEAQESATPDTRPHRRRTMTAGNATSKAAGKADPAFLEASHDFLHSWLVADNFDRAAAYFSPRCNECVKLYLADDEKAPATPEEYTAYFRKSLMTVGKDVGSVKHLHDAMEPVQPDHDDLLPVTHTGEGAYTVVAVPDELAGAFLCRAASVQNPYKPAAATTKTYGNYFATLFALKTPGEHPAALTLLWGKDGGTWKIIAYELTTL